MGVVVAAVRPWDEGDAHQQAVRETREVLVAHASRPVQEAMAAAVQAVAAVPCHPHCG